MQLKTIGLTAQLQPYNPRLLKIDQDGAVVLYLGIQPHRWHHPQQLFSR